MIRFKDEGPGGPIWFTDIELASQGDIMTFTDVPVLDESGNPVWFTRGQAVALAFTLSVPFEEA